MTVITVEEMQNHRSIYLERVEAGETLVITRDSRPVAEIKPIIAENQGLRPLGLRAGEFTVPDDFDDPLLEEVLENLFQSRDGWTVNSTTDS
jgi:prevent-host-death family protein